MSDVIIVARRLGHAPVTGSGDEQTIPQPT